MVGFFDLPEYENRYEEKMAQCNLQSYSRPSNLCSHMYFFLNLLIELDYPVGQHSEEAHSHVHGAEFGLPSGELVL